MISDVSRRLHAAAGELIRLLHVREFILIMRLPRVVIAVSFFIAAVFLTFLSLRSSHSSRTVTTSPSAKKSGFNSLFSFTAPFSLFPPNAIITLTHENSTAFLARPAAFGPSLPQEGLNGRVWIGSGFGDDAIHQGSAAVGTAGELGCSDVPSWSSHSKLGAATSGASAGNGRPAPLAARFDKRGRDDDRPFDGDADSSGDSTRGKKGASRPAASDGTDDYLHHPLSGTSVSGPNNPNPAESNGNHADIQSIQESAEIAGKIVLLSRGGCGFLEKVMWAQRRGAIALIVGDDIKGGPLIQMYARGDTSNVTIPSIFTSRTTAHLLSSLVGSGNFIEDSVDEKGNPTLKVLHTDKPRRPGKKHTPQPTSTTTMLSAKATVTAQPVPRRPSKDKSTSTKEKSASQTVESSGWLRSLFFGSNQGSSKSDSAPPPKGRKLDWVLVEDWKDGDRKSNKKSSSEKSNKIHDANDRGNAADDDFIIGVQDWRDPDLVGPPAEENTKSDTKVHSTTARSPLPTKPGKKHVGLQDASENNSKPGSGSGSHGAKADPELEKADAKAQKESGNGEGSKGLFNTVFGDDEEDARVPASGSGSTTAHTYMYESDRMDGDDEDYDGLWVTLTPTSGASPFLDTILVLVVSPLITLTVVYTLLLVRSRIRRRRWRAPKSVVERLPVRTYQTISSPDHQTPRLPSPSSSSAATPLLQQSPVRPRPRSQTTTGIPEPGELTRTNSSPLQVPSPAGGSSQEHEKTSGISPEWKKYMGRQVECVVCLEEYVDGVSRVMSLPCGHEFHADCM